MIQPLRARHRRWITALAVLLPAAFVLALAARPAPPAAVALSPALDPAAETARPLAGWDDLWRGADLSTRVSRGRDGGLRLDLEATAAPAAPDLLVYWVPSGTPAAGSDPATETPTDAALPPDAMLLGPFAGGAYGLRLPPGAAGGGGLLLYSLAHGRIAAGAELPPIAPPAPGPETAP